MNNGGIGVVYRQAQRAVPCQAPTLQADGVGRSTDVTQPQRCPGAQRGLGNPQGWRFGLSCCAGCTLSLKHNNSLFKEKNMKEGRKDWKYQCFPATLRAVEGRLPLKASAKE